MRRFAERAAKDPEFAKYLVDKIPSASKHWQEINAPHNKPHIEKLARVLESGHEMAKWFKRNPKMLIGPVLAGVGGYVGGKMIENKYKKNRKDD
jgi:hypothetical protein